MPADPSEDCKHGLKRENCALCKTPKASRLRSHSHGPSRRLDPKYFLIWKPERDVTDLPADTRQVHLSPRMNPTYNRISSLLNQCPNLKKIRIVPSKTHVLSKSVRDLLTEAGVELIEGKRHCARCPQYDDVAAVREWVHQNMTPEQQLILVKYAPEAYHLFRMRYLNGDKPPRLVDLARQEGMHYQTVQRTILSVLHWLKCPLAPSGGSRPPPDLHKRICRARAAEAWRRLQAEVEHWHKLPEGLPVQEWGTFRLLTQPKWEQAWGKLSKREEFTLRAYYGLGKDNRHLSMEEIGRELHLSRERVRQLRNMALKKLGITRE